jgi:serine phosphatase RsbU (regulator of sigma subunit)
MFGKLRIQLLLYFLIFAGINVLIVILYYLESNKKQQIEVIEDHIHDIELLIYNDAQLISDFFNAETRRSEYFETHNSTYLDQHHKLFIQIITNKDNLLKNKSFSELNSDIPISNIQLYLDSLKIGMDSLTDLVYLRGFRGFGMEGALLDHALILEGTKCVELSDLLILRRHEKDYFIRNEAKYIKQFNDRLDLMKFKLNSCENITKEKKDEVILELLTYQAIFNRIVEIDRLLGIKDNTALKKKLDSVVIGLLQNASILNQNCKIYKQQVYKGLRSLSIILVFVIIGLAVFLSLKLSKRVTKRLSLLSENISDFVGSCFLKLVPIQIEEKEDEVGLLIRNFELLKRKIHDQINYLEVKVAERTEEITIQKEQILDQNRKLMDSLHYALNIQEAILPHKFFINQTFPNHFIFFSPKDIVSGDFYWFKRIENFDFNISVIAIGDCTGHGVPGALMSMLGIAFLNDIIIKKDVFTTANILNKLRKKVIDNFSQQYNSSNISDGMDVAIALIDHKNKKLQYSGANRDLVLIRNGELHLIKGDRMPIGKYVKEHTEFTYNEIDFLNEDSIYMFTDGFADQFGGNVNGKYLRKNLKQFLLSINHFSMEKQKQLINSELHSWMKNNDQTDDILLAGFKLIN